MPSQEPRPTIHIPGTTEHTVPPRAAHEGTLRYLKAGTGAPLVLLHTVRTQAEHFRGLIPLIADRYTVYALDLPGMGYSEIVPGASYDEPAMRAGVERLLTELDLHDVTLVGESMGAVLALTTAADLPERVRRVVAVNAYDFRGGIARSGLLARLVVSGVLAPGVGPRDRRRGTQARPARDPSRRPRRQERAAGGLRGRTPPGGRPPGLSDRRPGRLPGPAEPHRGPLPLPRGQGADSPRLRREGLVPPLGPGRRPATASCRRLHPGLRGRPLHRARAT
ncbi:alpha/beta fold hydrolase [Streptomyces griseorubiginosus]|uniref:alpha/beta fold hydrolase n=1 Tax=Streptomyces griseorubiginosus TaxID=67304 RepID=UPI0036E24D2A